MAPTPTLIAVRPHGHEAAPPAAASGRGPLWEVVGGEDKGGILVRQGKGFCAEAEAKRLATGAVVEELELDGDRLRFARVAGAGPDGGWVSVRIRGKELLVRKDVSGGAGAAAPAEAPVAAPAAAAAGQSPAALRPAPRSAPGPPAAAAAPAALPAGRRLRVLGLHGGGSNQVAMQFQVAPLRLYLDKALGAGRIEWEFLNGRRPWQSEADPMTKAISSGEPLWGWYDVEVEEEGGPSGRPYLEKLFDTSVTFTYGEVEAGVDHVLDAVRTRGPFDVLVAFSQGCIVSHLVAALLRRRGEAVPWRLSVQVCGMRVRDARFRAWFETPLAVPCVQLYGLQDAMYAYGRQSQPQMYEDPVILEFDEGHRFPSKDPKKTEIHARILEEILKHCGSGD